MISRQSALLVREDYKQNIRKFYVYIKSNQYMKQICKIADIALPKKINLIVKKLYSIKIGQHLNLTIPLALFLRDIK
jgi:hypothetical protein